MSSCEICGRPDTPEIPSGEYLCPPCTRVAEVTMREIKESGSRGISVLVKFLGRASALAKEQMRPHPPKWLSQERRRVLCPINP